MTKTLTKHNIDVIIKFIKTFLLFSLIGFHILFSPISFYLSCSSDMDINEKIPNTFVFIMNFKLIFICLLKNILETCRC